ncbi:tRNA pseudouridine(38-40) synthase TruA [Christensenellaceae bacterium OttesenSCG-928-M15]|nr:tRNA pseudouridine(38-40) synthase TruA [Christensenellaceae bacterium OttesenSCG-928-M15]
MRRIRLIIEYDGTNYVGWQTQKNGLAIQAVIENELYKITGERISLHASGRTDSGVHALAQVAHFDTGVRMPAEKFSIALNTGLPRDIRVLYSGETDDAFHSRFSAKRKRYRYTLQLGPHSRVFTRNTALHVHGSLDISLMQAAAIQALGEHDFLAFMAAGSRVESTVRTIYHSEWAKEGCLLHYNVEGSGFLYNMVRILAGTMLDVGKRLIPSDSIERALLSRNRNDAGATAPAHGLTLMRVWYKGFDTQDILDNL